jgi:hypothetical protein
MLLTVSTSCVVENDDKAYQRIEFKNDSKFILELNFPQGIMDAPEPRQLSLNPGEIVGLTSRTPILFGATGIDCDNGCGIEELNIVIPDSSFTVRFIADSCGAYRSPDKKDYFNPCCPAFWVPIEASREDLEIFRYTFGDSVLNIARDYEVY